MSSDDLPLDDIVTQWSLLRLAHQDGVRGNDAARRALLMRYSRAIRRYLGAVMRDEHAADDVAQELMVRMMKGGFASADRQRGRFRDLLKHSARNMARNYWSREKRRAGVDFDTALLADADESQPDPWDDIWVRTVLEHAWEALEEYQRNTKGSVAFTILKLRTEYPDDDSTQLAEKLSAAADRAFNAAAARQQLRRARLRFAQLLIEELARGLSDPSPEAIEAELAGLGLMEYVRDFLPDDWRQSGRLM